MTTLAHSAVVAAFMATLGGSAALAGVPVYRVRLRAIGQASQQAVVVRKIASNPRDGEIFGHPIDWISVVQLECYARAAPAQASDEACDALLLLAHNVLAADPSLGGVIDYLSDPSITWDEDEKDTALGCAIATYNVMHRTGYRSLGV